MLTRSLLRRAVLLAATAALTVVPAAHAALTPAFGDPQLVTDESTTIVKPKVAVSATDTFAVWRDTIGGDQLVRFSRRANSPGAAWSSPETVSTVNENVTDDQYYLAADRDGNLTVLWRTENPWKIEARTLLAGQASWSTSAIKTLEDTWGSTYPQLVVGPDGTVVAAWGSYHDGNSIRFVTRAANSEDWGDPVDVDMSGDNPHGISLTYNAAGDGLVVADVEPNGTDHREIRAARYSHQDGTWGPAAVVAQSTITGGNDDPYYQAALSPQGTAAAAWTDGGTYQAMAATAEAGSNSWSDAHPLEPGRMEILPQIASTREGDFVVVYQAMIPDADQLTMFASSRLMSITRDASSGAWSETPEVIAAEDFAGAPTLIVDADYNLSVGMFAASAIDPSRMGDNVLRNLKVRVASRLDGADSWDDPQTVFQGDVSLQSMTNLATGPDGDLALAFTPAGAGTARSAAVALGDANGPKLGEVTAPSSGSTGEDLAFSANPFDLWSGIDSTTWDFGDGTSAAGTRVTHTYGAAGTYTVTIASSDLAGQRTTTTRTVSISDPPARPAPPTPTPTPPVILAPTIEALLAGKQITLTAKISLRSGKSCSGKVTATTAFGTTTYRTTLTLKKSGRACIATGSIKLKKAPSLRTKLRVTISGKSTKTRTLTTRRS